jgi:hypothetical protein
VALGGCRRRFPFAVEGEYNSLWLLCWCVVLHENIALVTLEVGRRRPLVEQECDVVRRNGHLNAGLLAGEVELCLGVSENICHIQTVIGYRLNASCHYFPEKVRHLSGLIPLIFAVEDLQRRPFWKGVAQSERLVQQISEGPDVRLGTVACPPYRSTISGAREVGIVLRSMSAVATGMSTSHSGRSYAVFVADPKSHSLLPNSRFRLQGSADCATQSLQFTCASEIVGRQNAGGSQESHDIDLQKDNGELSHLGLIRISNC